MRSRSSSSFSLPVLLSFNELAWIAVFGVGLAWTYTQAMLKERGSLADFRKATNELAEVRRDFETASNQVETLQRATNELGRLLASKEVEVESWSNQWWRAQSEFEIKSNRVAQLEPLLVSLSNRVESLEGTNGVLARRLSELEESNRQLRSDLAKTNELLVKAQQELDFWRTQARMVRNESVFRQEIVGLKGGTSNRAMSNVVFVLDRSGSMEKDGRWQDTLNVVSNWLELLPIRRCALVTFNEEPNPFPVDGSWVEVGGTETNTARSSLVGQLAGLGPSGYTDTLKALKMAYKYEGVDTIILFTDGKPELPKKDPRARKRDSEDSKVSRDSEALMAEIRVLCRSHAGIPVNTVGVGAYFDKRLAEFLITLAKETGGTFLGR